MFECVSDVGHMRLIRKLDDVEEVGAIHNEIDELGSTIKHPNRLTSAVSFPALDRYQRRVEYRASPSSMSVIPHWAPSFSCTEFEQTATTKKKPSLSQLPREEINQVDLLRYPFLI